MGTLLIVVSVVGFFLINFFAQFARFDLTYAFLLGVPFLVGLASLMLVYLRGGAVVSRRYSGTSAEKLDQKHFVPTPSFNVSEITDRLDAIQGSIESVRLGAEPFSDSERLEVISAIRSQMEQTLSVEFLKAVDEKYGDAIKGDAALIDLDEKCGQTEQRLRQEIESLTRRGNINLVIGVLTTLIAVGILASTVITGQIPTEPKALAAHFVPRLTLSIFIEVFSFFFLRLYSTNLNDIKYFQNELTNLESKFIALRRAVQSDDTGTLNDILRKLAETERNFVLKKGESTVDLEKSKLDLQNLKDLLSTFSDTVKRGK